tara:strand:+ start:808 stop:2628 length:1821 start_codon:yes stop_codon:yes gene_type:complete
MRYLSFSPYFSGLSNIIMSYELILSIAHITKRKIVLPPDVWMLFHSKDYNINDWKKKDYVDIWKILDKDVVTKEFDCIDFYDVPEFQGKFEQMETERSYTGNIGGVIDASDISCYYSYKHKTFDADHIVFTGEDYINVPEFDDFCQGRKHINLNDYTKKFLHFENNLFGHYWYITYPGDYHQRNILKDKINRCLRYKNKFYELSKKVKDKIGDYNSVHVRRNDFLLCHADKLVPSDLLLDKLYAFFERSKPLYIATDEKDLSFFDPVREKYDIYFYKDFNFNTTALETDVMDQVICAGSDIFVGTYLSTYTKRINVMRGVDGRQADDDIGINRILEPKDRIPKHIVNPWKNNFGRWEWPDSSHPQWKVEQDGKYVDQLEKLTVYEHTLSPKIKPPKFNKIPFKKIKLPDELYDDLYDEYYKMKFESLIGGLQDHPEWGRTVSGISNVKTSPHIGYAGVSDTFKEKAFNILTPIMEDWTGVELTPTVSYGVRNYPDGSVLHLHRDVIQSHVLSCIVYVDRKSTDNWALNYYDHQHNHHEVFFEKGDVLLYESLCVHGRTTPFEGDFYRNMYFHWRPTVWEHEFTSKYQKMKSSFRDEKHLMEYYAET